MTLMTPQEVADTLKISYEKALEFVKYSGIPYIKVGRMYRVDSSTLNTFLQSLAKKNSK